MEMGHKRGTLLRRGRQNRSRPRRRDPDATQETWLIHYDDIGVEHRNAITRCRYTFESCECANNVNTRSQLSADNQKPKLTIESPRLEQRRRTIRSPPTHLRGTIRSAVEVDQLHNAI